MVGKTYLANYSYDKNFIRKSSDEMMSLFDNIE